MPVKSIGLTVSGYPTFFGYIPKSSAKVGEFTLLTQNNQLVYKRSFTIPSQPGIVSIRLPANASPPLEIGKMYQWYLEIVCDPDDRSDSEMSVAGWIQRTQTDQALFDQIKNATPRTLPAVYANAGIWQDALINLVALRRSQPNNATLVADWTKLLKSVGLQSFSQEPLIECCKPGEQVSR